MRSAALVFRCRTGATQGIGPRLASALLLVTCAVCAVACTCDGATFVRGVVRDSQGRPVGGASVRLVWRDGTTAATAESKRDGSYTIGTTHPPALFGTVRLTVTKDGYVDAAADCPTSRLSRRDVTLTLRGPASSP